jgi:hypothetical protein
MSLYSFASSRAHSILSKLIDLGVLAPTEPGEIVASAKSPEHGMQVVITIASCEPWTANADALEKFLAKVADESPSIRLTPQMKKIVAALANQPARKAHWIAIRIGKKRADGNLRGVLAEMVANGTLKKGDDGYGYELPPTPESGHSRANAS